MYDKSREITAMQEAAFCVVRESGDEVTCVKNRYKNGNMEECLNYEFEKVKLSELCGSVEDIHKRYYGKNVWLLDDQSGIAQNELRMRGNVF